MDVEVICWKHISPLTVRKRASATKPIGFEQLVERLIGVDYCIRNRLQFVNLGGLVFVTAVAIFNTSMKEGEF